VKLNDETFLPCEQMSRSLLHMAFNIYEVVRVANLSRSSFVWAEKTNYATGNFVNVKSHTKKKICSQGKNFKKENSAKSDGHLEFLAVRLKKSFFCVFTL